MLSCGVLSCVPRVGWLGLYVKYNDIVASGVQNCSVVINDLKDPLDFATNVITFSTPPIDVACSTLKMIERKCAKTPRGVTMTCQNRKELGPVFTN